MRPRTQAEEVNRIILLILCMFMWLPASADGRMTFDFNPDWLLSVGDCPDAERPGFDDSGWSKVSLPRAFNQEEAFRVAIDELTDTVCWYRKHFTLPDISGGRVFIEFEGVRQGADFYLNGHPLGCHENGVMAVGFDLTPYISEGENVIAVRTDNSWDYTERETGVPYQWNDRNFNASYGGIPKNVRLHVTGPLYQTLPLYSNLGTTGVYVYATDIDIPARTATVNAESEVRNDSGGPVEVTYRVSVIDRDGTRLKTFASEPTVIPADAVVTLSASAPLDSLNFWSWGFGYLYDIETELVDAGGRSIDRVTTRTGFRKTGFGDGLVRLNDRVIQLHGYAQRTSNEWPGVGMSVPPWLSDFSNALMVESGANLVRWMHVTPWKQDVESCDRVGLIQAMPAGDSEKDRDGRQWEMREELMRDAIIYNRNNPSILFYESGNYRISPEHMERMKAIRDKYDPHGGRAIGSREMLDVDCAEYGGEMLYINRSKKHPMFAHEYCRDEGLRLYWDDFSYPFHRHGDGPLYRGAKAVEYNQNQDLFAVEMVRRWYDYWIERPGGGDRCSSGGAKIVFSDTNTHFRGAENYRRSGVVDPMRIPKDAFFAHHVMWRDAWVDTGESRTHIVGHWNYPEGTVKPVYVVSSADSVELRLNGRTLGPGKREYNFLHTFEDVGFEPGTLVAIGRDADGHETSRHELTTAGEPVALRLTTIGNPAGFRADGADMVLIEIEAVDERGLRAPLDNRTVSFALEGAAEWVGGIAKGDGNCVLSRELPLECGVNRVLIRSTREAGDIRLTASAPGLPDATVTLTSQPVEITGGLGKRLPAEGLAGQLGFGPTPLTPSFRPRLASIGIESADAGSGAENAARSFDDNEKTEWRSKGGIENAWITYRLGQKAPVSEIVLKLRDFRKRSYPLEITADGVLIWKGDTPKTLGYIHIRPEQPVTADSITLRLAGASEERDAFTIRELGQENSPVPDNAPASKKPATDLGIIEIEFLQDLL